MPYTFSRPDDLGDIQASELHTSLGQSLGAQAGESIFSATRAVWRNLQFSLAAGDVAPGSEGGGAADVDLAAQAKASIPDVPIEDAKARVKQAGLEGQLTLPNQPSIKKPVLDLMLNHAHERADYNAVVSRGPQGFFPNALGFLTSVGAGMIDPVGVAAFMVPVAPEAVWASRLAKAGDSIAGRLGERALQGAAQGVAGTTALQPADWWLHTHDGQDYTFADTFRSIVLGAGMGAAFHAGIGAVGDVRARMQGQGLPGSPEETLSRALQPQTETPLERRTAPLDTSEQALPVAGTNNEPAPGLSEAGATPEALPPGHPAHVLADLPQMARADVSRAAAADMIAGRPVRVAEMLNEAAKVDPRIAESVAPVRSETSIVINGRETRLANGRPVEQSAQPQSLLQFIAAQGGVSSKDPLLNDFLQALGGKKSLKGAGKLVSPGGVPLDRMREAAVEAGYLHDPGRDNGGVSDSTVRDLIDAVDTEARGQKVYARGEEPVPTQKQQLDAYYESRGERGRQLQDADAEIGRLLDEHGLAGAQRDEAARRAYRLIVTDETRDPRAAVDRALDELDIQGNRPGVGESDLADWEQFKDARPEYEDPQAVAESHEAARAPEPAAIVPERALSAAEKTAADARELLADMKPRLSEEEWNSLEEALSNIDSEKGAGEQIVRDGAACLAAAVGL